MDNVFAKIASELKAGGFSYFSGIRTVGEFRRLALLFGEPFQHPHASETAVTTIADRNETREGLLAFSSRALNLHTDASAEAHPPALLFLWCERAAVSGGEAILSDGREAYRRLILEEPKVIDKLESPTCQKILSVIPPRHFPIYSTDGERRFLRFRRDSLVEYPAEVRDAVEALRRALDSLCITVPMAARSGYVINNGWFAHGRNQFSGNRCVHRIHVTCKRNDPEQMLKLGFVPRTTTD